MLGRRPSALSALDGNDKEADKLQVKREELTRARERAEIRAQALTNEKPAAARLDAQDRLNEISGEAAALAKANEQAREAFHNALDTLTDCIKPAFGPATRMADLKKEAQYWAESFNLPLPSLPEISRPDPAPVKAAYFAAANLIEAQFAPFNEWIQKLAEYRAQRKRERVAAERHP